ncbi:spore maturation protein [Clostridium sp. 19966]|uniref:nucleoside recognition domain-containing protein n=1 Tax=Clostridium sp. 19966 TaxID=2768166 RepID=UPI0028E00AFF|nr:nucleoside recognition domain-containing protein [Clostridium sp. 19966]MDT8717253.1 spore maturation protein [Clostridium sp. 19966]
MINYLWFFILFVGVIFGIFTGRGEELSQAIVKAANTPVEILLGMVGILCMWCGVMKIAERSGLTNKLANLMKPVLKKIYKGAGRDEKALGAIVMNLTANMMGLSNAATPFGIKAMEEMQRINKDKDVASDDMALFLVMNACCVQIIPTTIISLRAAAGSAMPAVIIVPAFAATFISAVIGVICCKILEKHF